MVNVYNLRSFFQMRLGMDPYQRMTSTDWLSLPQQRLLEIVSGEVYYDGLNDLSKIRQKFAYYPRDVWLYLLACQWTKISQEEAFVGRTGDVGDELGSQSVAARLVREIMRLSFLMEQRYIPYTKWLGSGFEQLPMAKELSPILRRVMLSRTWKEREKQLAKAYEYIASKHNSLHITKPMPTKPSHYYGRPYLVIHGETFAGAIREKIASKSIFKKLKLIGSIDQFVDSVEVSSDLGLCKKLTAAYE